ncbi:16S rRNA (cytidine(1402)-2'-O)-methyltransferase [Planctomycetota bacterium]
MLYIVATPIGNLKDITFRAVEVLKECDVIVAEDSRKASIILKAHDIGKKRIVVYNEYNEKRKTGSIIDLLAEGTNVALTSDAGTPGIGDPGYLLVKQAAEKGLQITSIPGPCALISALVCSGFPMTSFKCTGFIPRKTGKKKTFFQNIEGTTVFYESPHRIHKTLALMAEIIPDKHIVIGREMTKIHEEFVRGTAKEVCKEMKDKTIKGELTIVVY